MVPETYRLEAKGIAVALDLGIGAIARFEVEQDGRTVAPFHRAPWADDAPPTAGTESAPHLARLSGDFFCAPFGASDVETAPPHGWPANAAWRLLGEERFVGGITARFELEPPVMGARLTKRFTLRDGHPFLYQAHSFVGGSGRITAAHHPMLSLPNGGRLAFSAKREAQSPDAALEANPAKGRSILAYPARIADLSRFPKADGSIADLSRYPIGESHEDFVMLVEAAGSPLGWTAVLREGAGDLALLLKDPAVLPVTMLWYSNGGRAYAPWNGRHRGVLGVEDACAYSLYGHAASLADNPLSRSGVPTALTLDPDGTVEVRHVMAAVPVPEGFGPVGAVVPDAGVLCVTAEGGMALSLPFDAGFLAGEA